MKRLARRCCIGILSCALPAWCHAQPAAAQAPVSQLEAITVTATRTQADARTLPLSISVIDADRIAQSGVRTVQDLLSAEAGIHVLNSSGSSDNAIIDLRGFGMTGSNNTLVLVDGVRQQDNDLSGPSLGTIPLAAIERIEIVRGAGAVQYGAGATGGVINIITRDSFGAGERARASLAIGNFGTRQYDLSVAADNGTVAVDAYGQRLRADNYRDNNAERREGGGGGITVRHDGGSLRVYGRTSTLRQGLPGPRTVDPASGLDQYDDDPRGTNTPHDHIRVRASTVGLQFQQRLGPGSLYLDLAQRDKDQHGFHGDAFGDIERDQDLAETSGSARYQWDIAGGHSLTIGGDWLRGDLDGSQFSPFGTDRWNTRQRRHGVFAEARVQASPSTLVTLGARRQYASDRTVVVEGFMAESNLTHRLTAWQAGVRQGLAQGWSAYAHIGRSLRLPTADELYYVNEPLLPQTSLDKEVGLDWSRGGSRARLSWFRYDLKNELHYNALADGFGANVNLAPTRREGLELSASHAVDDTLTLRGNLTWLRATFRSGRYGGVDVSGNRMPLVPEWMANAGATWRPLQGLALDLAVQYVGRARLDNDQANQFDARLPAYVVVNSKASYRFNRHIEASLAVNNLFDRRYATYGIRSGNLGPDGRYNLYPGSGRSVIASLAVRY